MIHAYRAKASFSILELDEQPAVTLVANRLTRFSRFLHEASFVMTCPLPLKNAVAVPVETHSYSRNIYLPVFKRVNVVNTVSIVFLPSPLKIVSKMWELEDNEEIGDIYLFFFFLRRIVLSFDSSSMRKESSGKEM